MILLGAGMPLLDSLRFETHGSDKQRFNLGEIVEIKGLPWVVTRLNTVMGTIDITPLASWENYKAGKVHSRPPIPDEYGRVGVKPKQHGKWAGN